MYCQQVCPENKQLLQWIEGEEEFTENETRLLLENTALDALPASTVNKLRILELTDYLNSLSRNLSVFFKR